MKIGYSNLLGEHVPAEHLHHKDCEPFQVVCPACREPIFKAERDSNGTTLHYLSHYAASKAYQVDCELRVGSIPAETIRQTDKTSRDQRLQYFLQVLRAIIAADKIYAGDPAKTHRMLNKSKSLAWMRQQQFEQAGKLVFSREDFSEAVQGYIDDLAKSGGGLDTAFALSVQERIAYDVWVSLLTPKGRPNYEFLFNHAYVRLLARIGAAADVRPLSRDEQMLYQRAAKLIETSKQTGMQMMAEMARIPVGPPFAIEGSNMLAKLMSEIMHEMIGTLVQLPYFETLKRRLLPA